MRLGQFGADLIQEGFDVLRQRGLAFALVEFFQAAFLALRNVAVDTFGGCLGVALLKGVDQVLMIPVDLFQRGQSVTSAARGENADQQTDPGERPEAPLVARELHDVGVERQVGNFEALHLLFVEDRLAAGFEFLDQRGERRGDGADVAQLCWRWNACGDGSSGEAFQGFPNFEQLPNVIPVQSDDNDTAGGDGFEETFADQLPDRFARGGATDAEFLGDRDVGNRLAGAQCTGGDFALDVVVGHFAHRAFGFGWSWHASMILALHVRVFGRMYTVRPAHG